jgi:hypothetical protein
MNDNGLRIIGYLIKSHREWLPFADVTIDDTVLYGMLPASVTIANNAIENMIKNYY